MVIRQTNLNLPISVQPTADPNLGSTSSLDMNDFIQRQADGSYTCQMCAKTSTMKHHIWNHLEATHFSGQFVYSCQTCNKTFNSKNSFAIHKTRYHKN